MRSLVIVSLAVVCCAGQAAAEKVPSRAQLGQAIADLELKLAAVREEARRGDLGRAVATEERLAAIEKGIAELRASAATGDVQAKLEELSEALEELSDDAATKSDLRKYVRKPDESEYKSRQAQELELRLAFVDLREDEIQGVLSGLGLVAMSPTATPKAKGIVQAATLLGGQLLDNDRRARPRLLFRPTWEASRFLDGSSYLHVSATPEITLFVYDKDIDRALIPRDAAHPRDRLGVSIKKAAAGAQLGRLGIQAGVLQFTYGAGFFLNPTNVFTPKNPLDPRREVDGVPAAKLDLAVVQSEAATLGLQLAAVGDRVRNDVLGEHADALGFGGLAMLKLDTHLVSLTGLGIAQSPDAFGESSLSAGGIASVNPFGLTASVEGLVSERHDEWAPELVASIQGFTSKVGANGTTYILEYVYEGHAPRTRDAASMELVSAVVGERALETMDILTRALGRRHYANVYLEPSLTQKLRINLAALVGFDESPGALLRGGFDYDLYNLSIHAFGGALVGSDTSEFGHHFIQAFGELAVFASF